MRREGKDVRHFLCQEKRSAVGCLRNGKISYASFCPNLGTHQGWEVFLLSHSKDATSTTTSSIHYPDLYYVMSCCGSRNLFMHCRNLFFTHCQCCISQETSSHTLVSFWANDNERKQVYPLLLRYFLCPTKLFHLPLLYYNQHFCTINSFKDKHHNKHKFYSMYTWSVS